MTPALSQQIQLLDLQTSSDAHEWCVRQQHVSMIGIYGRAFGRFVRVYVAEGAYRKGVAGMMKALLVGWHPLLSLAKYIEMTKLHRYALATQESQGMQDNRQPYRRQEGQRNTLAVVLMTKNEEARLEACLKRVADWADEIVIIDDMSADRTVEIAHRYTKKVYSMPSDDDHARQWNRGIERATSDWILHIDADEWVTPRLQAAIDQILIDARGCSAFDITRKNFFLGRPMLHGGWYHRHRILFRRDRARCIGRGIHSAARLRIEGPIGFLDAEIEHYPFNSISQFIQRQNHYTSVEAGVLFEEQGPIPLSKIYFQAIIRPYKLFWKRYVKQRGFRDGWHGFVFAILAAFMHFVFWAKYWELAYQREEHDISTATATA